MVHARADDASGQPPLISVVMPFKDAGEFFEQSARCVLEQTWPAVHLVLVDDGGSDGSVAVAERIRSQEPDRVLVVSHPGRQNRGIGASRRLGFRHAAGEFVANLDADDLWEPGHLEHEVRLLMAHPEAQLVCSRTWVWHSWRESPLPDELSPMAFAPGTVVPGTALLAAVLRNGGYSPATCSVLVRTAALRGGSLDDVDDFPGMYEDQVLNSALLLRYPVLLSGAVSAWYRQHDRSISAEHLRSDAASRFDGGREQYLQWLARQPLLVDPQVRAQLDRNLQELRERLRRPTAPADRQKGRPDPARQLLRGARAVASRTLTRSEVARERRSPSGTSAGRAAAQARPERLRLFVRRYGADLRGAVLVLGGSADLPEEAAAACTDRRALPPLPGRPGPQHPLARLPTAAYDCVLVDDQPRPGDWQRDDLRHLQRALAPGGVLLLALHRPTDQVQALVRETFGADQVRVHWQVSPGPGRRPLLGLRAIVPR